MIDHYESDVECTCDICKNAENVRKLRDSLSLNLPRIKSIFEELMNIYIENGFALRYYEDNSVGRAICSPESIPFCSDYKFYGVGNIIDDKILIIYEMFDIDDNHYHLCTEIIPLFYLFDPKWKDKLLKDYRKFIIGDEAFEKESVIKDKTRRIELLSNELNQLHEELKELIKLDEENIEL